MVAVLKKTKRSSISDVKDNIALQKKCSYGFDWFMTVRDLITKWKKDVTSQLRKPTPEQTESSIGSSPQTNPENSRTTEVSSPEQSPKLKKQISEDLSPSQMDAMSDSYLYLTLRLKSPSLNPTRTKFRNLLFNDFKDGITDQGYSVSSLVKTIGEIEGELSEAYNKGNEITAEYRQRFRDIRFNLGNNKQLLGFVIDGDIKPSRLVRMSTDEMMSDEVKKEVRMRRTRDP